MGKEQSEIMKDRLAIRKKVAEEVMGLTGIRPGKAYYIEGEKGFCISEGTEYTTWVYEVFGESRFSTFKEVPHYESDWTEAHKVIRRLQYDKIPDLYICAKTVMKLNGDEVHVEMTPHNGVVGKIFCAPWGYPDQYAVCECALDCIERVKDKD